MAQRKIYNTILDLNGTPIQSVEVQVTLVPGPAFIKDTKEEIASRETLYTSATGYWEIFLQENSNINPSGTYYEVEERIPKPAGGTKVWRILVGGTDSALLDCLTPMPIPIGSVPNYATQEWVSSQFLRNNEPGIQGPIGPTGPTGAAGSPSVTIEGTDTWANIQLKACNPNDVWILADAPAGAPAIRNSYLTGTVGQASTPDPGPLPTQFVLVARIAVSSLSLDQTIIGQWQGVPQFAWVWYQNAWSNFAYSVNGSAVVTRGIGAIGWTDTYIAVSVDGSTGLAKTFRSSDGITWTEYATWTYGSFTMFDSTSDMTVGRRQGTNFQNQGRIYWAEARTGTNPAAGTLLWKFDASDYPGTGTSYVDPRGRTWNLTSASAIAFESRVAQVGDGIICENNVRRNIGPIRGPIGPPGPVGLLAGGTTGQVLAKKSNTDQDVEWKGYSVPAGGTRLQHLVKTSDTSGDLQWKDVHAPFWVNEFDVTLNGDSFAGLWDYYFQLPAMPGYGWVECSSSGLTMGYSMAAVIAVNQLLYCNGYQDFDGQTTQSLARWTGQANPGTWTRSDWGGHYLTLRVNPGGVALVNRFQWMTSPPGGNIYIGARVVVKLWLSQA